MNKPKAFMSYAHVDDEDGSLTSLRTLLRREVRNGYRGEEEYRV